MSARLILASTSRWRREQLERLHLPFDCEDPGVDETARPGEAPAALARRLARAKAEAVHARHRDALVLAGDQVAVAPDGAVLGKPGSIVAACAQLRRCSGRAVRFLSAVALAGGGGGRTLLRVVPTTVHFRTLADDEIARYVGLERPLDCAGSFRVEALGIVLFERVVSRDPTALVGLPMIATAALLRDAGLDPLRAD